MNDQEYWLCKICHNERPNPREPSGHIYRCTSTSAAIEHLERKHRINSNGIMPIELPRNAQRTIDSFNSLIRERNDAILEFDLAVFKAMLVRLFAVEALPLIKVESATFRDLLIYLQPNVRGCVPSRRSLMRYISYAYRESLSSVVSALASAKSKIHLSFDLWTSPSRRLSLLGVVAHYLDDQ